MAGPIKISVLADVGQAVKSVTKFSDITEEQTHRVVTTLGDPKLTGGFGKAQEGFDVLDTRAMGFRDTITGVQDTMTGFQGILGDRKPGQTFADSLLQVGMGVGDLASGMANFILPVLAITKALPIASAATKAYSVAQAALNLVMSLNPVFLVVAAIVALVAVVVIAYKKSETFRRIVDGAFRGVWNIVQAVVGWIRGNWPLLFAILTGPIGLAVRWIVQHWSQIVSAVRRIPGQIRAVFSGIGSWLVSAGRDLVAGFVNGIKSMIGQAVSTARNMASSAANAVKGFLHIGSPSKLFEDYGMFTGQGFLRGLEAQYRPITSSLGGFTAGLGGSIRPGSIATVGAPGPATISLSIERSGDQLIDALMEALADRISVRFGGSVQSALGR